MMIATFTITTYKFLNLEDFYHHIESMGKICPLNNLMVVSQIYTELFQFPLVQLQFLYTQKRQYPGFIRREKMFY